MKDLPLNALRALAAIREAGGVRPAARILSISPSAVHRHLRLLEQHLLIELIDRTKTPLAFTAAGDRLSQLALDGLAEFTAALEVASQRSRSDRVVIACTESFAGEWLIPRLPAFREAHPRIDLWISPEQRLIVDPDPSTVAIRMGSAAGAGGGGTAFMQDRLVPVATMPIARTLKAASAADLPERTLLHDQDVQASWARFAASHNCDARGFEGGARLGSSALVLEAAALGLGVALAREKLAARRLANGTLGHVAHLAVEVGTGYWLRMGRGARASARAVRDWLMEEGELAERAEF